MSAFAGYTRVSRVGDREDTLISPDLQAERIRTYAAARGLEVELMPPELDVSGERKARPILDHAIEGVAEGRYAGVIVAMYDRLSRMNITDALKTIERIEQAGGQVISVAENFDAATPEGAFSRTMILGVANMQLDRYKLQFRAAKRSAVERGIWPTSTAPIGYTVTYRRDGGDGVLHPDPRTRQLVVQAYEARAAGRPWRAVADILGNGLSGAAKVIKNRVYLGEVRLGEWVNPSAHEPLVERDLWEAAQLEHPRPPRGKHPPALLGGLVRCAGCRGAMTPDSSSKGGHRERIYRCTANKATGLCEMPAIISQRKLDPYVERAVLAEVERLAVTPHERSREIEDALAELQSEEAELEAFQRLRRVADLGADAFMAGMRSRVEAVDAARRRLAGARVAVDPTPPMGNLGELWPTMSVDERRKVLRGSLGAVWVRRGRGPAAERVRLVAPGFDLPSREGNARLSLEPLDWVEDLPGEIRPAGS